MRIGTWDTVENNGFQVPFAIVWYCVSAFRIN